MTGPLPPGHTRRAADPAPPAPESALVGLAWHDVVCPEGEDCRDRPLHAASQTLWTTGLLAAFLDRLAAMDAS